MEEIKRVNFKTLEEIASGVLRSIGGDKQIAEDTAYCMVQASLRGIDTHGIALLPGILERIRQGRCQITSRADVLIDGPAYSVLDAKLSPGQHSCLTAARLALLKGRQYGIAISVVRDSNHLGACYPYVRYLVDNDLISMAASNCAQSMAVFGANSPNMGNNPIAFGVPVDGSASFIFDFATSVMSYGRMLGLMAENKKVPKEAFFKYEGRRKNIAYEIVHSLTHVARPFGAYKGGSIAMMIDILAGVLSGGAFGQKIEAIDKDGGFYGPCHFVLAINPMMFRSSGAGFKRDMRVLIEQMMESNPSIRIPGIASSEIEKARKRDGIPVSNELKKNINILIKKFGSSFVF